MSQLPPVIAELLANSKDFTAKMGEAKAQMAETAASGEKSTSKLNSLGKGLAMGLGAAVLGLGVKAIEMGEKFQTSTDSIANHAGISVKAAQQVSNAFLHTNSDVLESGQEIADAYAPVAGVFTSLYGHALNAKSALAIMTASSDLASASGQSLSSVTASLAAVMNAYHLPVKAAAETTDELFNISKATGQPIADLATGADRLKARLGTAAPTLADVGALTEALGRQGLTGSRGMLVVATAFQTLQGGSKTTNAELKKLGVSLYDSNGKFIGMSGVIKQLQPKLAGMSDAQKELALKTLFGASAAQVMGGIVGQGPAAFDALTASVKKTGTAHDAAAINAGALKGEEKQLEKNVDNLGTSLGKRLVPMMQRAIAITMSAVKWAQNHIAVMEVVAGVVGGVAVAAIGLYVASLVEAAVKSAIHFGKMAVDAVKWAAKNAVSFAKAIASGAVWVATTGVQAAVTAAKWVASNAAQLASFIATNAARLAVWIAGNAVIVAGAVATGVAAAAAFLLPLAPFILIGAAAALLVYEIVKHFTAIKNFIVGVVGDVIAWIKSHWELILAILTGPVGLAVLAIKDHWNTIRNDASKLIDDIVSYFTGLPARIMNGLEVLVGDFLSLGERLVSAILSAFSHIGSDIAGAIKGAVSHIPVIGGALKAVGLAKGGYVTKPIFALVGEAGPEFVIPKSVLMASYSSGVSPLPSNLGGGGGTISGSPVIGGASQVHTTNTFNLYGTPQQMIAQMQTLLDENNKELVRTLRAAR